MLLSERLDSNVQLNGQEFIWQQILPAQAEECETPLQSTNKQEYLLSPHTLCSPSSKTPLWQICQCLLLAEDFYNKLTTG